MSFIDTYVTDNTYIITNSVPIIILRNRLLLLSSFCGWWSQGTKKWSNLADNTIRVGQSQKWEAGSSIHTLNHNTWPEAFLFSVTRNTTDGSKRPSTAMLHGQKVTEMELVGFLIINWGALHYSSWSPLNWKSLSVFSAWSVGNKTKFKLLVTVIAFWLSTPFL